MLFKKYKNLILYMFKWVKVEFQRRRGLIFIFEKQNFDLDKSYFLFISYQVRKNIIMKVQKPSKHIKNKLFDCDLMLNVHDNIQKHHKVSFVWKLGNKVAFSTVQTVYDKRCSIQQCLTIPISLQKKGQSYCSRVTTLLMMDEDGNEIDRAAIKIRSWQQQYQNMVVQIGTGNLSFRYRRRSLEQIKQDNQDLAQSQEISEILLMDAEMADLNTEVANLKNEVKQLRVCIEDKQFIIQKLKKDRNELAEDVNSLYIRIKTMGLKAEQQIKKIQKICNQLLKKSQQEHQKDIQDMLKQLGKAQETIYHLTQILNQQGVAFDTGNYKAKYSNKKGRQLKQVQQMANSSLILDKNKQLQAQLEKINLNRSDMQMALLTANKKIKELESQKSRLNKQLSQQLQQIVQKHQQQERKLFEKCLHLQKQKNKLQSSLKRYKEEFVIAQQQTETFKLFINRLQKEKDRMQIQKQSIQTKLTEKQKELSKINFEAEKINEKLQQGQKQKKKLSKKLDKLVKDLKQAQTNNRFFQNNQKKMVKQFEQSLQKLRVQANQRSSKSPSMKKNDEFLSTLKMANLQLEKQLVKVSNEYNKQRKQLQQQISILQNNNHDLKLQLQSLTQSSKKKQEEFCKRNTILKQSNSQFSHKIAYLERKLELAQVNYATQIGQFKGRISILQQQLQGNHAKNGPKWKNYQAYQANTNLQATLKQMNLQHLQKIKLQDEVKQMQTKIESMKEQINQLQIRNSRKDNQIRDCKRQTQKSELECQSIKSKLEKLQFQNSRLKSDVQRVSKRVNDNQTSSFGLKKIIKQYEKQVQSLKQINQSYAQKERILLSKISKLQDFSNLQNEQLQQKLKQINFQKQKSDKQMQIKQEQIVKLQQNLKQHQINKKQILRQKTQQYKAKIEQLSMKVDQLKKTIIYKQSQSSQVKSRLNKCQKLIIQREHQLKDLSQKIQVEYRQKQKYKNQHANAVINIEELSNNLQIAGKHLQKKQQIIKKLTKQIAQIKQNLLTQLAIRQSQNQILKKRCVLLEKTNQNRKYFAVTKQQAILKLSCQNQKLERNTHAEIKNRMQKQNQLKHIHKSQVNELKRYYSEKILRSKQQTQKLVNQNKQLRKFKEEANYYRTMLQQQQKNRNHFGLANHNQYQLSQAKPKIQRLQHLQKINIRSQQVIANLKKELEDQKFKNKIANQKIQFQQQSIEEYVKQLNLKNQKINQIQLQKAKFKSEIDRLAIVAKEHQSENKHAHIKQTEKCYNQNQKSHNFVPQNTAYNSNPISKRKHDSEIQRKVKGNKRNRQYDHQNQYMIPQARKNYNIKRREDQAINKVSQASNLVRSKSLFGSDSVLDSKEEQISSLKKGRSSLNKNSRSQLDRGSKQKTFKLTNSSIFDA